MSNKLLTESKAQIVQDYISSSNSPYIFCGFEGGYYTNNDVVRRMKQHKSNSTFEHKIIYQHYFNNGEIPLLIENEIKNNFQCHAVTKERLFNGHTETINEKDYTAMMETIEILRKRNGNQN